MPEIAEVARVTHFLRLHLVGKTISKCFAVDDANVFGKVGTSGAEFQKTLAGRKVVGAGSQGKYFWILLDKPPHPVMHLGMTGWVHIRGEPTAYTRYAEKTKNDAEQWPPKFWKFHLETDSKPRVEVAFTDARRFGRVRLVDCPGEDIRRRSPLVENGPDPVIDRDVFTEDYLRTKMRARHVPVKALLLDQAMISGIGNWVGDEIMYQAKLHPEQYSDEFDDADISTLYRAARYVCDTACENLADSDKFPEDWLFNHRWGKGKKDSATALPNGEKITFITVGGRTSCIAPGVQKKRGKAANKIKEEADEKAGNNNSPYFESKGAAKVNGEADEIKGAAKRTKTSKRKEVKMESEDETEIKVAKRAKGRQPKKEEPAQPAVDPGRRRSTRLNGRS